jgi:hypothetical protein
MAIVTTHYRPKRAPRKKRKQPALANRIVTPAPMKKGPLKRVIRLRDQTDQTAEQANDNGQEQPRRSAIVTPKGKRTSIFGDVLDVTPEEHQRRGDAADALFREIARA